MLFLDVQYEQRGGNGNVNGLQYAAGAVRGPRRQYCSSSRSRTRMKLLQAVLTRARDLDGFWRQLQAWRVGHFIKRADYHVVLFSYVNWRDAFRVQPNFVAVWPALWRKTRVCLESVRRIFYFDNCTAVAHARLYNWKGCMELSRITACLLCACHVRQFSHANGFPILEGGCVVGSYRIRRLYSYSAFYFVSYSSLPC